MKDKVVCVEWEDASFNSGYYDKDDKTGKFSVYQTKTVGFLVKSDKKVLLLAQDRFYKDNGALDDERRIAIIPKGMIRRIIELREKEK